MTDDFSTCPICDHGVLVSQIVVNSSCIVNNYSCGHKLERIYDSVKISVTAELKIKSLNGAFIGKKKREYEIEERFKTNDRDDPGKETVEMVFIHHGSSLTSVFHVVKYSNSGRLKHIDCKICSNGWRLDSGLPVENSFLFEHNPEEAEAYPCSFKIQCLKCNAKYENFSK